MKVTKWKRSCDLFKQLGARFMILHNWIIELLPSMITGRASLWSLWKRSQQLWLMSHQKVFYWKEPKVQTKHQGEGYVLFESLNSGTQCDLSNSFWPQLWSTSKFIYSSLLKGYCIFDALCNFLSFICIHVLSHFIFFAIIQLFIQWLTYIFKHMYIQSHLDSQRPSSLIILVLFKFSLYNNAFYCCVHMSWHVKLVFLSTRVELSFVAQIYNLKKHVKDLSFLHVKVDF